jgi:membrane fusion protein, multidrug efflux system
MENEEKKSKLGTIIKPIILILIVAAGVWFGVKKYKEAQLYEKTDNAQVEATSAPIIPRVPGYVKAVHVKDYESVQAGDLLFEIDPSEFLLGMQMAQSDLAQSRADVENARAGMSVVNQNTRLAESNIAVLEVRKEQAYKDYKRLENLVAEGAVTQKQFEDAKSGYEAVLKQIESAREQVGASSSNLNTVAAQIKRAEAVVNVKESQIDQARLRLTYTAVYAPVSGKIGKKSISEGQYINAGQQVMTIINDASFWVVANFKETQLERIKPGQEVEIKLDAYPKEKIIGEIVSISEATGSKFSLLAPDNATGNFVKVTQRVPVKIAIRDLEKYREMLRSGLSAEVSVKVK